MHLKAKELTSPALEISPRLSFSDESCAYNVADETANINKIIEPSIVKLIKNCRVNEIPGRL